MAAVAYLDVQSALNTLFEDELASQINRATVGVKLLPKKPVVGKSINWDARLGVAVGTAQSDGASISTYNSDTKAPAKLDIATYQDSFKLDGRAVASAANAGGPNALVDLFGEHIMEASERVASAINIDLYSGTGALTEPITIAGLNTVALLADTGTYANVSRNTYSQWKSNVLGNSSVPRALTIQLMRDMMRTIYTASGHKPDLIVCDPFQHEQYGLTFGPFRRYITGEMNVGGKKISLDGGFNVLEFDGIPVVEDKDCVAGTMNFLNTKSVRVRPLPFSSMQMATAAGELEVTGSEEANEGPGNTGLRARIQRLANDGDFQVWQVVLYVQVQCTHPNRCGVITDLATS